MGVLCGVVLGDDTEGWWVGVVVVAMVVWLSGWKCMAQQGGLGQKCETAVGDGGEGWCSDM